MRLPTVALKENRSHECRPAHDAAVAQRPRNPWVDFLKAAALILVIVDHVALLFFELGIEGLRVPTRLAEPLFAVCLGWGLAGSTSSRILRRSLLVGAVGCGVASTTFPVLDRIDVLISFFAVYLLFAIAHPLRSAPWWLAICSLGAVWDPSGRILDYPLSMVLFQVSGGIALRRERVRWHVMTGTVAAILAGGSYWMTYAATVVAFFLLKAATELDGTGACRYLGKGTRTRPTSSASVRTSRLPREGARRSMACWAGTWGFAAVSWLGRHTILIYAAQAAVLFGSHRAGQWLETNRLDLLTRLFG